MDITLTRFSLILCSAAIAAPCFAELSAEEGDMLVGSRIHAARLRAVFSEITQFVSEQTLRSIPWAAHEAYPEMFPVPNRGNELTQLVYGSGLWGWHIDPDRPNDVRTLFTEFLGNFYREKYQPRIGVNFNVPSGNFSSFSVEGVDYRLPILSRQEAVRKMTVFLRGCGFDRQWRIVRFSDNGTGVDPENTAYNAVLRSVEATTGFDLGDEIEVRFDPKGYPWGLIHNGPSRRERLAIPVLSPSDIHGIVANFAAHFAAVDSAFRIEIGRPRYIGLSTEDSALSRYSSRHRDLAQRRMAFPVFDCTLYVEFEGRFIEFMQVGVDAYTGELFKGRYTGPAREMGVGGNPSTRFGPSPTLKLNASLTMADIEAPVKIIGSASKPLSTPISVPLKQGTSQFRAEYELASGRIRWMEGGRWCYGRVNRLLLKHELRKLRHPSGSREIPTGTKVVRSI